MAWVERWGRAVPVLAFMLVSGCIGGGSDEAAMPASVSGATGAGSVTADNATYHTDLDLLVNATLTPDRTNLGDWWFLSTKTSAEGGLAGFSLVIPPGAIVSDTGSNDQRTMVAVELAPLMPSGQVDTLRAWSLVSFENRDGQAHFLSAMGNEYGEWEWTEKGLAGESSGAETPDQWIAPHLHWLGGSSLQPGQELRVVLAARTTGNTEFGVGLRFLEIDPWEEGKERDPEATWDAFLKNRTSAPRLAPRTGLGSGFILSSFYAGKYPAFNGNDPASAGVYSFEGANLPITYRDALPVDPRPGFTLRDLTIESGLAFPSGFGRVQGIYYGLGAAGQWSAQLQGHGAQEAFSGHMTPAGPGFLDSSYFNTAGLSAFTFQSDGQGVSQYSFHLQWAEAATLEEYGLANLEFGAPLMALIGWPGEAVSTVLTGAPVSQQHPPARLLGPGLFMDWQPGDAELGPRS